MICFVQLYTIVSLSKIELQSQQAIQTYPFEPQLCALDFHALAVSSAATIFGRARRPQNINFTHTNLLVYPSHLIPSQRFSTLFLGAQEDACNARSAPGRFNDVDVPLGSSRTAPHSAPSLTSPNIRQIKRGDWPHTCKRQAFR